MMDQFSKWGPDVSVSSVSQFQTQINIIEGDGQVFFIKPTNFCKCFPGDQQAGPGHSRDLPRQNSLSKIASIFGIMIMQRMPGYTTHPNDNTCMLNVPVGIIELGAYCSYLWSRGMRYKFGQPPPIFDFDVIVEESKNLTFCVPCSEVVDSREIKFARVLYYANIRISLRVSLKECKSFWLGTIVVNQDDFNIFVGCLVQKAIQAHAEKL